MTELELALLFGISMTAALVAGATVTRWIYKKRLRQLGMFLTWPTDAAIKLSNPDDPFSDPEAMLMASRADYLRNFWAGKMEETLGGVWVSADSLQNDDVVELRRFDMASVAARMSPDQMSDPSDRKERAY